jgi:hypothetical protein
MASSLFEQTVRTVGHSRMKSGGSPANPEVPLVLPRQPGH